MPDNFLENNFILTTELTPPKGVDLSNSLDKAKSLPTINAFNVTDNHNSNITMSPLGLSKLLIDNNIQPILQMTCRDRNVLALQSDLLSAYSLGINNILCMSGESTKYGDHPEAKNVFDINSEQLISIVSKLNSGYDYTDNKLNQNTNFNIGAVFNPGASDIDKELVKLISKIKNGATFFQTQAIYSINNLDYILEIKKKYNIKIIAGFIPVKSAKMANFLNTKVPGITVPETIIEKMKKSHNPKNTCIEISKKIISEIKASNIFDGIHIMALGQENIIPEITQSKIIS